MAYSDITTLMSAATTALASGDYATARDKALAAQALLGITPDTTESTDGGGSRGMTWDRVAITQFIDRMQRLLNSKTGIQSSKVTICPVADQGGPPQIGIW